MGWNKGSGLFSEIIDALNVTGIDKKEREELYDRLIDSFENMDCDTLDECIGEDAAFDKVWKAKQGKTESDDEEDPNDAWDGTIDWDE